MLQERQTGAVELRCHESPELRVDGTPVPLALKRGFALLCILAESPRPAPRELVTTLLWPDAGHALARTRLRRLVHEVNRRSGLRLVEGDASRLRIAHRSFTTDVGRLRDAALAVLEGPPGEEADAAQSLLMQAGPIGLLEGFRIESEPFQEWVQERAALLQRLVRDAWLQVARSSPDARRALTAAERALAMDACDEGACLAAVRLLVRGGDAERARRAFLDCLQALRSELGVAPSAHFVHACEEAMRGALPLPLRA